MALYFGMPVPIRYRLYISTLFSNLALDGVGGLNPGARTSLKTGNKDVVLTSRPAGGKTGMVDRHRCFFPKPPRPINCGGAGRRSPDRIPTSGR